jgi:hypothetical protein
MTSSRDGSINGQETIESLQKRKVSDDECKDLLAWWKAY